MKELEAKYNAVVRKYIEEFEKKQGVNFEFWVADRVGEMACFGAYFFDFIDIRVDINENVSKDVILEWHNFILEEGLNINYRTFLKIKNHGIDEK